MTRGGMPIHFVGRKMIVGGPRSDLVIIHQQLVMRYAVILIEVLHRDCVVPTLMIKLQTRRARILTSAGHALAPRHRFPWRYVYRRVAGELHGLGLDAVRIVPDTMLRIFDPRKLMKVVGHGIAPHDGMPRLILLPLQHLGIARIIY